MSCMHVFHGIVFAIPSSMLLQYVIRHPCMVMYHVERGNDSIFRAHCHGFAGSAHFYVSGAPPIAMYNTIVSGVQY